MWNLVLRSDSLEVVMYHKRILWDRCTNHFLGVGHPGYKKKCLTIVQNQQLSPRSKAPTNKAYNPMDPLLGPSMLMRSMWRLRQDHGCVWKYQEQQYYDSLLFCPIHGNLLLLEIPPVFFINQNQIEVILHAELVVDVFVGWGQIIRTQEQPDWNRLACTTKWVTAHVYLS